MWWKCCKRPEPMQALDSDPELIFQPMHRWCRNMSNKIAAVQMPFGCFALRQSAPLTRDCRSDKIAGQYADVVELVDSLDLGSNARACRFESCHPHQKRPARTGLVFFDADGGLEEGGLAFGQGKKVSGGHFFSPGKSPWMDDGRRQACWHPSIFCVIGRLIPGDS